MLTQQTPEETKFNAEIGNEESEAQNEAEHFLEPSETPPKVETKPADSLNKPIAIPQQITNTAPPKASFQDEITVKIEKIMEDGLADAFLEMTTVQKQEFKIKGEAAAAQIREILRGTKIKVKKIFQVLVDWLKMIPGVNRFFIEQEAKIKADRIFSLSLHDISRHSL